MFILMNLRFFRKILNFKSMNDAKNPRLARPESIAFFFLVFIETLTDNNQQRLACFKTFAAKNLDLLDYIWRSLADLGENDQFWGQNDH